MSSVSLKVQLVDQGTVKTMQFAGNMTIAEVCRDIRERTGGNNANSADKNAGSDHGIYYPLLNKWLAQNRTLDFYDMKSCDTVDYKKKHRPLRVKLLDGAVKTVLVDDSQNVADLVEQICKRIGMQKIDEFSIQHDPAGEASQAIVKREQERAKKAKGAADGKDKFTEEGHWFGAGKVVGRTGRAGAGCFTAEEEVLLQRSECRLQGPDPAHVKLSAGFPISFAIDVSII